MNKDAETKYAVTDYDTAKDLRDDEEALDYLMACAEESGNDPAFIAKALGTIARSRVEMATVAKFTGLSRESLYKALSGERDPSFSTILKVSAALGFRLTFEMTAPSNQQSAANVATSVSSFISLDSSSMFPTVPSCNFDYGVLQYKLYRPAEHAEWEGKSNVLLAPLVHYNKVESSLSEQESATMPNSHNFALETLIADPQFY